MRKICALILLVMLGLPGAARAYYFEVTPLESSGPSMYHYATTGTNGNQADFKLTGMSDTSPMAGRLVAQFALYSDDGRDIFTDVTVKVRDKTSIVSSGAGFLSTVGSVDIFEPVGEGGSPVFNLTFGADGTANGSGALSIEKLDYYGLTLTTGVIYILTLEYSNLFDGVFTSANRAVSLDVCGEDCPATPIPGAAWLLGTGLVGLVGLRKRFFA